MSNRRAFTNAELKSIALFSDVSKIDLDSITICENIKLSNENLKYDEEIIKLWDSLETKPRVIVFDLDLTLWPFWVDSHVSPPFEKISIDHEGFTIVDKKRRKMTFYKDVPMILNTLKNYCLKGNGHMAIASRTNEYKGAIELIEHYGWKDYFMSFQMYSGSKAVHMEKICEDIGGQINKNDILFFDDKKHNIDDTKCLGITAYELDQRFGLTREDCLNGLKMHNCRLIESKRN